MGVATEVAIDVLGTGEGGLGVDQPVLAVEQVDEAAEVLRGLELRATGTEDELARLEA